MGPDELQRDVETKFAAACALLQSQMTVAAAEGRERSDTEMHVVHDALVEVCRLRDQVAALRGKS